MALNLLVPKEGSLQVISPIRLLSRLERAGFTGQVSVMAGGAIQLFVKHGKLIHLSTKLAPALIQKGLGESASVLQGLSDADQRMKIAVLFSANEDSPLAEENRWGMLIQEEKISPSVVFHCKAAVLQCRFDHFLAQRTGRFVTHAEPSASWHSIPPAFNYTLPVYLLKWASGTFSHAHLDELLANLKSQMATLNEKAPLGLEQMPISMTLKQKLKMLDGSVTLEKIWGDAERDQFMLKLVFYLLVQLEAVRLVSVSQTHQRFIDEKEVAGDVSKRISLAKDQNALEILGLPQNATPLQVKQAYLKLAKKYHPDRFRKRFPALIEQIESLFSEINAAYTKINSQEKLDLYRVEALQEKEETNLDFEDGLNQMIEAESFFAKGQISLKSRRYGDACGYFDEALKMMPDKPEFIAYKAWAMWLKSADTAYDTACDMLRHALKIDPVFYQAYYFLGKIHADREEYEDAARVLHQAASLNPNDELASRELRLLRMRKKIK